ncbi:MAG TPA: rRNA maturation RNase YbeY [Planctomycetaceae bacterium]|nr:rRNA maturation RNase YbeY [Planctomycetaceae bacterium]
MVFEIDISNNQSHVRIDTEALKLAVVQALHIERVHSAVLSVSIVDNLAIHRINRDHLQHDFPTDVISFQLDFSKPPASLDDAVGKAAEPQIELRAAGGMIEGEIIASAQMAAETVAELTDSESWTVQHELTLYVIHGLLHICGYDDMSPEEKRFMRSRERAVLNSIGLTPIFPDAEY